MVSRRRLLGLSAVAALGAGGYWMSRAPQALPTAARSSPPVSARISPRITLHMFQTGWVAVKREHRAFNGPAALRLPAIMASRQWTEWLPVTAFAIEHPEGLIMVDTGESARITTPDYTACDGITGMFYTNNLQFTVSPEDEIGPQMTRAGLVPKNVRTVIMSHLHSDHMGGMGWFPNARFLVSEAARGGHAGALMCRIPARTTLDPVRYANRPIGAFAQSVPVTQDGTVSVVPTPGHARGHQSVLIEDAGRSVCVVGDAAFNLEQVMSEQIAGIVEDPSAARRSAALLKTQVRRHSSVLLPTHDPGNAARLRAL